MSTLQSKPPQHRSSEPGSANSGSQGPAFGAKRSQSPGLAGFSELRLHSDPSVYTAIFSPAILNQGFYLLFGCLGASVMDKDSIVLGAVQRTKLVI